MSTVLGIGNCQLHGMVQTASVVLGLTPAYLHPETIGTKPKDLADALERAEVVFARIDKAKTVRSLASEAGRPDLPVIIAPRLHFSGYHPDLTAAAKEFSKSQRPMGGCHSAILLAAWRDGLTVEEALTLFRDEVYEALGYYDAFALSTNLLVSECSRSGLAVEPLMEKWMEEAPFFYIPLHPKISVIRDVALAQLRNAGLYTGQGTGPVLDDILANNVIWPVYPEIGERLGTAGDYVFRPRNRPGRNDVNPEPIDLEIFVERSFASYRVSPPNYSQFPRMADPRFQSIRRFVKEKAPKAGANPYADLPPIHWWNEAVAEPSIEAVDPVREAKFTIGKSDKIATAGSCFAQHIARRLDRAGFNYLVTEQAPPQCADPEMENYGTFTARFGNIYTVRQLLQLVDRAYGKLEPAIDAWPLVRGAGYVDPFRPRIGQRPFPSVEALRADRDVHFAAVRQMFETADVFVFTLGLTECWWSQKDLAVVPVPPGAMGADVPTDAYNPKNFTAAEVIADLQLLLEFFQRVNPGLKVLLTVSPVPLVATFEKEHVLAATTYSKSVLRVAAGEVAKNNEQVAYFPSYEIITGSYSRGRYFAEDLRQVTSAGVDHVMRSFLQHYAAVDGHSAQIGRDAANRFEAESLAAMNIICDEEAIQTAFG